jgi:NADPH2:quinone reductase
VRGVRNDALAEGARAILGRGADVIIDPVGGEITGNAMSAGAPDCKHILLGFSSGAMMPILAPKFLGGEHQLIGFNLLRRSHEGLAEHVRAAVQDVISGGFAPEIDSIHPLAAGVAAYAHAAQVRGRVLLQGSGA